MEKFKEWIDRFEDWVREEPVRASEAVRAVLFAVTGFLAVGDQATLAAISGAITAAFSIYASKSTRDSVSPVHKIESYRDDARV